VPKPNNLMELAQENAETSLKFWSPSPGGHRTGESRPGIDCWQWVQVNYARTSGTAVRAAWLRIASRRRRGGGPPPFCTKDPQAILADELQLPRYPVVSSRFVARKSANRHSPTFCRSMLFCVTRTTPVLRIIDQRRRCRSRRCESHKDLHRRNDPA